MKQICHGVYCSLKKWLKLSLKTYFSGHFERFFVYTLMYPITAKFFTYKDLIEVRNCGKLRQYSICGCQVINFQGFLFQFSIHELSLFVLFWTLTPPNFHKR